MPNDYVKFIRFAQWRIEQTGYGILAFITNHGYLDNPTFRGMRQSLMNTFDDIYVLDLHGNSKKKEKCIDGSKDESVFDIQQGVAISIFVKQQDGNKEAANVYHANLYGLRESKYQWLKENDVVTTQWKKLKPQLPFYLFIPQNTDLLGEYEEGWKVTDIFPVNSMGITTGDDDRFVAFNDDELKVKCGDIINSALVNYRPFDNRQILYQPNLLARARVQFMQNFISGNKNLALITIRRPRNQQMGNFFVSNEITDKCIISSLDNAQLFALYIYPNSKNPKELEEPVRPNLSPDFLNAITSKLGYAPTPETIFYYIYAILHSPTYRTRYAEFLKIDFPRVPLTSNNELFHQLANYGEELVSLHLMKSPQLDNFITKFVENNGNNLVDTGHPKYNQDAVIINKKGDKFTGITEEVWKFQIGGYQVCQKWLKDRKGRQLNDDDIQHYQRIVVALQQTIKLMDKIDQAIPGFPIQ